MPILEDNLLKGRNFILALFQNLCCPMNLGFLPPLPPPPPVLNGELAQKFLFFPHSDAIIVKFFLI
jgi:hypothetical protein